MAQFLKEHLRESIIAFSLEEFAQYGYSGANMANIAKKSGISTGNIYRYFKNKAQLFEVALPASFVHTFLKKIRKRVRAYPLGIQPNNIPTDSSYTVFSEELLQFTIENRLRVIILLEGSRGSIYEKFAQQIQIELTKTAIEALKLKKLAADAVLIHSIVEDIYENFLHALCTILRRYTNESTIRTAVTIYSSYHLGGLTMIAS